MCIFIQDLYFETIIGILPKERIKAQRVRVNAKIKYDYIDSASYLDYANVANYIMQCMQTQQYKLLEEALHDIALQCIQTFPNITTLTLYIEKPDILPHCRVGMRAKFYAKDYQK